MKQNKSLIHIAFTSQNPIMHAQNKPSHSKPLHALRKSLSYTKLLFSKGKPSYTHKTPRSSLQTSALIY